MARLIAGEHEEAGHWFERGAAQGDPSAMYNLGVLALDRGAEDEAVSWFGRAHEAGHSKAADVLEQLRGT